jgi:hypothetical protein
MTINNTKLSNRIPFIPIEKSRIKGGKNAYKVMKIGIAKHIDRNPITI